MTDTRSPDPLVFGAIMHRARYEPIVTAREALSGVDYRIANSIRVPVVEAMYFGATVIDTTLWDRIRS